MQNPIYTNDLVRESSPYLLQHAHNPVNWRPWNDRVLQQAQTENKLIIISIGYAACHWCHVMENESFEDAEVAAVMNADYIAIKVDREERPDVDQLYMNAVHLMTGSGGWPLNVVALPDGRPVWGGMYFRKKEWIEALGKISELFKSDPKNLLEYASRLEAGIKSMDLIHLNSREVDFENLPTENLISKWGLSFDTSFGGNKNAPKFMMPNNMAYLLRAAIQRKDEKLLSYVNLTLEKMAFGGIYDHIGGGFARYSIDEKWHVPHFEKMLYDNAQLVSLYSQTFSATQNPLYREIVEETLEFINREMTHHDGNFYSSLDADSENEKGVLEEGAFYVFTKEELQILLKGDFDIFQSYYNINDFGRWEEKNYVLIRDRNDVEVAEKFSISLQVLRKKRNSWKEKLLTFRNQRTKPRLDDKSLTSWNALMLKGYVDCYKVFQKREYLDAALKNARFISEKQLQKSGALFHNYKNGKSTINGFLEDYASVAEAFISLYEITLDLTWMKISKELIDYSFENFFDEESQMFFFTSKLDTALIAHTYEYRDNVIASSNSMMAKNLFKLSRFYDVKKYEKTAHQMLKNILPEMENHPSGFSNWLDLLSNYQNDYFEVIVVGAKAWEIIPELNKEYLPNALIAGSLGESKLPLFKNRFVNGETLIYVCMGDRCLLPVEKVEEVLEKMLDVRRER